ncbi:S-crystallin SL11-like [Antedon mediterranea]|uniref:S-crystallin SL11-like n=1 Tax=Antedon mediterranea TaxID=105859 RepID=UPI003AF7CFD5
MPSYELLYFDARGRCEDARFLFALAGVEYKDIRFTEEEWPISFKSKALYGVVPNLTVDGKTLSMTLAISNYLAREFGYYGKSNWESAQIDVITNALHEVIGLYYTHVLGENEDAKAETLKNFTSRVESYGVAMEKGLKENNGGDGYLVGNSLTLADIAFFNAYSEILTLKADALDNAPKLKALMGRVSANEKIAEWIKKRPKTQY